MNMSWWLNLFIGCVIVMMGVAGCAKAERTVSGTRQFIHEHVKITDSEQWNPDDAIYWQMWQDSQGGG